MPGALHGHVPTQVSHHATERCKDLKPRPQPHGRSTHLRVLGQVAVRLVGAEAQGGAAHGEQGPHCSAEGDQLLRFEPDAGRRALPARSTAMVRLRCTR